MAAWSPKVGRDVKICVIQAMHKAQHNGSFKAAACSNGSLQMDGSFGGRVGVSAGRPSHQSRRNRELLVLEGIQ